MKKPLVNIVTLGCSKNKVDSERLAASLSHRYDIVHDSDKKSEVVIINTCGFIGDAKEESIDTILEYAELRRAKKIKKLYVTGCLSQRYRKDLQEEIHEVDGFFGVESVQLIANYILKNSESQNLRISELQSRENSFNAFSLRLFEDFRRLQPSLRFLRDTIDSWRTCLGANGRPS